MCKHVKKDKLQIAWVQSCAQGNVAQNLAQLDTWLAQLQQNSPDVVVLPETFAWLQQDIMAQADLVEPKGVGRLQQWCVQWAQRLGCYVVAGSLPLRWSDGIYASLCVFNPLGACEAIYRKMHLFSVQTPSGAVYGEQQLFRSGPVPVLWHSPWGPIGLAICFDVRFPSLFRYYAQQGALLTLLPAAFTAETGSAHWHILVRARAIETQSWVLAVNQVGQHDAKMQSYGHSLLVDPWGDVIEDAGVSLGVFRATVDLDKAEQLRAHFPLLALA
jgi:nitrilase